MARFCLLHGKWHAPACWDPLRAALTQLGHDSVAPDLPLDEPAADYETRTTPAIAALDRHGDAMVVVGHSIGAAYGMLAAARRPVALLVHLDPAPVGPFAGAARGVRPYRRGFPFPPDDADGVSAWAPDTAAAAMYGRLAPELARAEAERLRPGSAPAGSWPLAEPPDVPARAIVAAEDEIVGRAWSHAAGRELTGAAPIELAGGHFPMLERPDELARVLDRLADELSRRS